MNLYLIEVTFVILPERAGWEDIPELPKELKYYHMQAITRYDATTRLMDSLYTEYVSSSSNWLPVSATVLDWVSAND